MADNRIRKLRSASGSGGTTTVPTNLVLFQYPIRRSRSAAPPVPALVPA
ncbi:MAG: hypothetical protein ACM3ZV_04340 [Bacillota bacterium]